MPQQILQAKQTRTNDSGERNIAHALGEVCCKLQYQLLICRDSVWLQR